MTAFARKVAELVGTRIEDIHRLAGGDLSEVLLVPRKDGRQSVAKRGSAPANEAAMLRILAAAGLPTPMVEGEYGDFLMLEHVGNDALFSPRAWADIGVSTKRMHDVTAPSYGWTVDHPIGSVQLDNRRNQDWPAFWTEQRLLACAALLDRPLRQRIETLCERLHLKLPQNPRPALLHGDYWSGNLLVKDGRLAAMIDPACYHGHAEVDLAMLCLFSTPPNAFWEVYGELEPGWSARRPIYQLFPALVHLRLFGASYLPLVSRLLESIGEGTSESR